MTPDTVPGVEFAIDDTVLKFTLYKDEELPVEDDAIELALPIDDEPIDDEPIDDEPIEVVLIPELATLPDA